MKKFFLKTVFLATCILFLVVSPSTAKENIGKNWKNAQEAYAKICAYCHNTGVGVQSVKVKYPDNAIDARSQSIIYTVRHGLGAMPAFRQTEIDNQTLKELSISLAKGEIK